MAVNHFSLTRTAVVEEERGAWYHFCSLPKLNCAQMDLAFVLLDICCVEGMGEKAGLMDPGNAEADLVANA